MEKIMIQRESENYLVVDCYGNNHNVMGSQQIVGDFVIIGNLHTFFRPRAVLKR